MTWDVAQRVQIALVRLKAIGPTVQRPRQKTSNFTICRASRSGDDLVLKVARDQAEPRARLMAEADAMAAADTRAPGQVAKIFAYFEDIGILALEDAGAATIGDRMISAGTTRPAWFELAQTAGRWAAAFHDGGRADEVPLWPKKRLQSILENADWTAPGAAVMRAMSEQLLMHVTHLRGAPIPCAVVHSDLHPHNLVVSPQGHAVAIDILRNVTRPVMTDISRFLIYAQWLEGADREGVPQHWGLNAGVVTGFASGYGLDSTRSNGFLHACEILRHWRFQVRNGDVTANQMLRINALVLMAENMPADLSLTPPSPPIHQ